MWLDNKEISSIATATSRKHIKKLINDRIVVKKQVVVHSRARTLKRLLEKRKGRHMGDGKRRGTRNARMPEKILWIRR